MPARAFVDDARIREAWDGLNAANGNLAVLSSAIVGAAVDTLASGSERLLIGERDGSVVAMALFTTAGPLRWSTFQPSQLPLGAVVLAPGEFLTDLGSGMIRGPLSPALALSFTQLDPLVIERTGDDPVGRSDDYILTAWIEIVGDFESYWASRGKNLRSNLRKQRKQLAGAGTVVTLRTIRAPEEMSAAVARYGELESRGWKADIGTAVRLDSAQGRFYVALLEAAAGRGEAVVYEYRFDDRVVAMNLCVHRAGTLVVLKTTYDESVKPLSPAFLLREEQLREIHETREFHRIEFYGRRMEWHLQWTKSGRMLFHTTVFRWPLVRRIADLQRRASEKSKSPESPTPTAEVAP